MWHVKIQANKAMLTAWIGNSRLLVSEDAGRHWQSKQLPGAPEDADYSAIWMEN